MPENNNHIQLVWNNAPANQTIEEYKIGMAWLFSYLGATLPQSDFERAFTFVGPQKFTLQIEYLGFTEDAQCAISQLIEALKASEEYKHNESVDAGRFFALCFNSSWHYYKITGADKTLSEFKSRYTTSVAKQLAVDSSSVAYEARLLKYKTNTTNLSENFFMAEEGSGHFTSGNFAPSGTVEAFDYMLNGQPRFMIFSPDGNLKPASETIFSNAGKPAKCMWCHESKMQPLFGPTPNILGYTTVAEFESDQLSFNTFLFSYHTTQNSILQFNNVQHHTQGEWIYLSFFEPNATRLSQEWGLSEAEVQLRLLGVATHNNAEFPFLNSVYHRSEIDAYSPWQVLSVCDEAREPDGFEPDYLP